MLARAESLGFNPSSSPSATSAIGKIRQFGIQVGKVVSQGSAAASSGTENLLLTTDQKVGAFTDKLFTPPLRPVIQGGNRSTVEVTTTGGAVSSSITYQSSTVSKPAVTAIFGNGHQVNVSQKQNGNPDPDGNGGDDGGAVRRLFHRLHSVKDRYGNELIYHYPNDTTLIPDQIIDSRRNLTLTVSHDGKRVNSITDPLGNSVSYTYRAADLGTDVIPLLERVTFHDGSFVHYGYDHDGMSDEEGNMVHHINLASILNPEGQAWGFEYGFQAESDNANLPTESKADGGRPRWVKKVILPGGTASVFENQRFFKFIADDVVIGKVTNSVTDVDGTLRTYVFGDARIDAIPRGMMDWTASQESGVENCVVLGSLDIHLAPDAVEHFEFDPEAGLALRKAVDLAGNTTTYEYKDEGPEYSADHKNGFNVVGPLDMFRYYNDPTAKINAKGERTEYTYDPATRVMNSVKDPAGRITRYTIQPITGLRTEELRYDASDNLLSKTKFVYGNATFPAFMTQRSIERQPGDPDWAVSMTADYYADAAGRIQREEVLLDADSNATAVTSYAYDANGNKTQVTDPLGRKTVFTYDGRGRLTSTTFAHGTENQATKTWTYDSRGNKVVEVNEANSITFNTYDEMNRLTMSTFDLNGNGVPDDRSADIVTSTEYNIFGQPVKVIDPNGNITLHAYDGLGRLSETTVGVGTYAQGTIEYFYEPGNNIGGSVFDTTTFKPSRVIDVRGYHTRTEYDQLYRPVKVWRQFLPDAWAVTQSVYDEVGNVVQVTDPLNLTTHTVFDALNRPVRTTSPDNTFTTAHYTSTGLKWKTVDELGRETQTEFDAAGRTKKVIAPATTDALTNQPVTPTVTTSYDLAGNVVSVTDQRGKVTTTEYDHRNRPIKIVSPGIIDASVGQVVEPTVYQYYDVAGRLVRTTDPLGNHTDQVYDRAGRVTTVYSPAAPTFEHPETSSEAVTTTEYDMAGNPVRVVDPDGRITVNYYGALNRLVQTTDPGLISTVFGHDLEGNRTSVTDGQGRTTTFAYDGLNRLLVDQPPSGPPTLHFYNQVNKIGTQAPDGKATQYAYDSRHRLTVTTHPDGSTRTCSYDLVGNLLAVDESSSTERDVAYTYDSHNRVVSETSCLVTHTYGYDVAGNRTKVSYGRNGVTLQSGYDALNRLLLLIEQSAASTRATSWSYDLAGNIREQTLGNGTQVKNVHDNRGRLSTRTVYGRPSTAGIRSPISFQSYLYDAAGNLRKMTERYEGQAADRVVLNTYDASLRLASEQITEADGSITTTAYSYDSSGNRTRREKSGAVSAVADYYYNQLNQLVSYHEQPSLPVTYAYDLNGNRIQRLQGNSSDYYRWDTQNRLLHVSRTATSETFHYGYDYRTRRVQRNENHDRARLVFSGGTSVLERSSDAPTQAKHFIRGTDMGGGVGGLLYSLKTPDVAPTVQSLPDIATSDVYQIWDLQNRPGITVTSVPTTSPVTSGTTTTTTATSTTQSLPIIPLSPVPLISSGSGISTNSYNYLTSIYYYQTFQSLLSGLQLNQTLTLTPMAVNTYSSPFSLADATADLLTLLQLTPAMLSDYQWYDGGNAVCGQPGIAGPFIHPYPAEVLLANYAKAAANGLTPALYAKVVTPPAAGEPPALAPVAMIEAILRLLPPVLPPDSDLTAPLATLPQGALQPSFNHYNGRGDVVAKTNASGAITWTGSYEAYGKRTRETGTNDDRHRANTKDEDPTGLLNEGFRYRDLETGTWLSRDPAGFVDGPNLYAYVKQNPWTSFDPEGLFKVGSSAAMGLYTTPAVHETITSHSFVAAARSSPKAAPVAWGDSYSNFVNALQEGSRRPDTQGYNTNSKGIPMGFSASYKASEKGLAKGDMFDNHFGSKQWNHSMSSGDPTIKDAAALSSQIQSGLGTKFNSALEAYQSGDHKAAGLLLGEISHTVQDSYSASHVKRGKDGSIVSFNNYAMQDEDAHGKADTSPMVRRNQAYDLDAMKKNIPGVTEATTATEGVFKAFFTADKPSDAFQSHMSNVFKTAPGAAINVSGGYEKKEKK